jgi:membrane-associated phospholipid phosphatase
MGGWGLTIGEGPWKKLHLRYPELFAAILVYVTVNAVVYLRFGKLPELSLAAVALLSLPVIGLVTRSKDFLRSSILFVTVLLTYEALQGLTSVLASSRTIVSLAWLDRALVGFDFASVFQTAFASSAATLLSTFFYGLHAFLIVIAIGLFWFKDRLVYRGYAYSMVLTSYLALLTFIIVPAAPPYLVGAAKNLLSTGNKMLPSFLQSIQTVLLSGEADLFAAFPSLHAAYATLFSFFMFKLNRRFGLVSLPILFGVFFSIIYLGQHYLVDLLAGVAYALFSAYIVERLVSRRKPGLQGMRGGLGPNS